MRKYLFPILILIASLALAGTAAYYSVFGLSKLFAGQSVAVLIMASILETSKLITASALHRYWSKLSFLLKTYLTVAVVALMCITSLGIYGFLVSAYQETSAELDVINQKVELVEAKKNRFEEQEFDISTELTALNSNIQELTKGLSNNVIQYKDPETGEIITTTSGSTRNALQEQLEDSKILRDSLRIKKQTLADSITNFDLQIVEIKQSSDVAGEIGPLKYVAELTNKPIDQVINWFILLFIFVFDPLAVILLVVANKFLKRTDVESSLNANNQSDSLNDPITVSPIRVTTPDINNDHNETTEQEVEESTEEDTNNGYREIEDIYKEHIKSENKNDNNRPVHKTKVIP